MAVFKDNPLKQVVDDLNIQNADRIPAPLKVENCQLLNPIADNSLGEFLNTRATLRVVTAADGYPTGEFQVKYRRLKLATLGAQVSTNLNFVGVPEQTKTLEEILQKWLPALASYILPELVDDGPYDLTRDTQGIVLNPKNGGLVLAPVPLILNVQTGAIDIASFIQLDNINPFTEQLPFPEPGSDVQTLILSRIALANGFGTELNAADCDIQMLPVENVQLASRRRIRVTVTNPNSVYKGTNTFSYVLYSLKTAVGTAAFDYTEGQTQAQLIGARILAANRWWADTEIYDIPMKPVRSTDYGQTGDATDVVTSNSSWVYGPDYFQGAVGTRFQTTGLYPYESIISFSVSVAGTKSILKTVNASTMPVTIELLEKPAAFVPSTLDVDANFTTTQSLPVGTYKIRITRPDSYRTMLWHRDQNSHNNDDFDIHVTEVHKLKGHNLQSTFQWCSKLTTVHPGAFDESTYTIMAGGLFQYCTSLANLPDHIFDSMTRCWQWSYIFQSCTSLTTIPAELFAFLRMLTLSVDHLFYMAGPDVIPDTMFKNVRWLSPKAMFQSSPGIKTIGSNFFKSMALLGPITDFSNMFDACTGLTAIPADYFSGVAVQGPLPGAGSDSTDIKLDNAFSGCTGLTSLPVGLFSVWIDAGLKNVSLGQTFRGCTGLTAIPSGFLDGLQFNKGSFYGPSLQDTFARCTNITAIPHDIFHNVRLLGGFNSFGFFEGTFAYTGITEIPPDLLLGNEDLTAFIGIFAGTKITAIPANLFAGCTELLSLQAAFQACTLLTTVPSGLFADCSKVQYLRTTFKGCTALASIPANLFTPFALVTDAQECFDHCGLTAIPTGLLSTCVALQTAKNMFSYCPLVGALDNVFTNQPALTNVEQAFLQTTITSAGAGVFSGAPNMETVGMAFWMTPQLASVHADLLKYQTKITTASLFLGQTPMLTTVPATLLSRCPDLYDVRSMFSTSGITSLPAGLFSGSKKIATLEGFASGCTALAAIPAGLFDGLTEVTTAYGVFRSCESVPAVPNQLFKSMTKCVNFEQAFDGCFALATIGTDQFGLTTAATSAAGMFRKTGLTAIPDGLFFNLKNLNNLNETFVNCFALTTIGRIVQNTLATNLQIANTFGILYQTPVPPEGFSDFTVADNLIDSTIVLAVTCGVQTAPFDQRSNWTKNIDNLFGANVRIVPSFTKNYFAGMKITGNGTNFIAKHQVPTSTTGFFKNSTLLSDYATLPAWAKT